MDGKVEMEFTHCFDGDRQTTRLTDGKVPTISRTVSMDGIPFRAELALSRTVIASLRSEPSSQDVWDERAGAATQPITLQLKRSAFPVGM